MAGTSRPAILATVVMVAVACGACAVPVRVNAYAERGADLSSYRTFDFAPPEVMPTGDARLDSNPFFTDRVQTAAAKQLQAKGYERATSGTPDLRVHFHASISQDILVGEADQRYCEPGDCRPFVYDAGTLLMDLVDVGTNKLVWRGWAESSMDGVVDNQSWMERKVDEAVARIIARLPPRS
jgi:hypothetical protein